MTFSGVQVGIDEFNDVVATVVPSTVLINGGMPDAIGDSASLNAGSVPQSATVNVPAIEVGGRVYTNLSVVAELQGITFASISAILHSFAITADGALPSGSLVADGGGNLFGTTQDGGAHESGTVFKVTPSGTESVLYSFTGGIDGGNPVAGLIIDGNGNLYGTTKNGGNYHFGTVFKIPAAGGETVLYHFTGGADGSNPSGGLVMDGAGSFYGTAIFGGAGTGTNGFGTVFKLTSTGQQSTLHTFAGGSADGAYPSATLVRDSGGNLYGTTEDAGPGGAGIVFKVTPSGTESIVHGFTGNADGSNPLFAGVVLDGAGNLYGTTEFGGTGGSGIVYKIDQSGTKATLYNFTGGADGSAPAWGVILDNAGNLYGTAFDGGASNNGNVFKVTPAGTASVLYSFHGGTGGQNPNGGLYRDSAGNLFGVTESGGTDFRVRCSVSTNRYLGNRAA